MLHNRLGQTELRDAVYQHASRQMQRLKNRHFVSQLRQIACRRQPRRACADHRNLVTVGPGLLYGLLAVLPVPVRHEPFQTPDSHRITLDPAYAFALALALLRAHPAAHRRQAG